MMSLRVVQHRVIRVDEKHRPVPAVALRGKGFPQVLPSIVRSQLGQRIEIGELMIFASDCSLETSMM